MIPFEIACDLIVVLVVEVRRKAESTPLVPVVFAAAPGEARQIEEIGRGCEVGDDIVARDRAVLRAAADRYRGAAAGVDEGVDAAAAGEIVRAGAAGQLVVAEAAAQGVGARRTGQRVVEVAPDRAFHVQIGVEAEAHRCQVERGAAGALHQA
jgi:hypothetical protein